MILLAFFRGACMGCDLIGSVGLLLGVMLFGLLLWCGVLRYVLVIIELFVVLSFVFCDYYFVLWIYFVFGLLFGVGCLVVFFCQVRLLSFGLVVH